MVIIVNPEHPEYADMISSILDRGDRLWINLTDIEMKYFDIVYNDGGYSYNPTLGDSKKTLLSHIDGDIDIVESRYGILSLPDFSNPSSPHNLKKDELASVLNIQQRLKERYPSLTYAQIRGYALRSYKHLERKYQALRADVVKIPDEAFTCEYLKGLKKSLKK